MLDRKSIFLWAELALAMKQVGVEKLWDITDETVLKVLDVIEFYEKLWEQQLIDMVRTYMHVYIMWMESITEKEALETKDDILRELDFFRNKWGDTSKNQVSRFREKLFWKKDAHWISKEIGTGSKEVSDFFEHWLWENMWENLYDMLKRYIHEKYKN